MTVVRSRLANTLLKDAIVLDLGDLKRQGDQLIRRAQETAQKTQTKAEEQARKIIDAAEKTGYDAGFEQGRLEGIKAGREIGRTEALEQTIEQLKQLTESWQTALTDLESARRHIVIDAKQDVLALAVQIARRVVHRTVQIDERIIADQLEQVLKVVPYRTQLVITVNPADHDLVRDALPDLTTALTSDADRPAVRLETDEQITRGGCRVHHDDIDVDATIETLLERIEASLLPRESRSLPADTPGRSDEHAAPPPPPPCADEPEGAP